MIHRQAQYVYRSFVYDKALEHYGQTNQLIVAVEELSEAQKEICKILRGDGNMDHLAEEIADAFIMLEQLERLYGITEKVTEYMAHKAVRLSERIDGSKAD